jgi:hypothetical protein
MIVHDRVLTKESFEISLASRPTLALTTVYFDQLNTNAMGTPQI